MNFDLSKVNVTSGGMVQLGPGQFVNKDAIDKNGYDAAVNYQNTKDGPKPQAISPAVQSDPTKPSSSASTILNGNATTAVNNAQNPPANVNDATIASIAAAFPSLSPDMLKGLDSTTLVNLALAADQKGQAAKDKTELESRQGEQYRAGLAQNNAAYAAARDKLKEDRSNSISTATAQLAALNSSGGISSDSGAFIDHIHSQYDMAENQLQLQAEQARAALDAGNSQAYEAITANMSQVVGTITANVQNMLSAMQGQKTQASQFAEAEKDKAVTAYSSMLQNLPQPEALSALPADLSKLSADQMKTLQSTSAYQQGIKAGLTPEAILADVKSAATSSKIAISKQNADEKAANDVARAQIAMFVAQTNAADKTAAAADAQRLVTSPGKTGEAAGSDFLDAFQVAQNAGGHTKQENADSLSNIADFMQGGKTQQAKDALTNYVVKGMPLADRQVVQGFRDVSGFAKDIRAELDALPANKKTGLVNGKLNDIAEKLGQTTDPDLARLKASVDHFKIAYTTLLAGRRGNSSYTSMIGTLLPSSSDNPELNSVKLDAIQSTSDSFMRSAVGGVLGTDTYDKIYGGDSKTSTSSGYVPSFNVDAYINDLVAPKKK